MKLKTVQAVGIVLIVGLTLLSGVLAHQNQSLKTVYEKLSLDFDALSKEHESLRISYSYLEGNYTALSRNFSDLQRDYSTLQTQSNNLQAQYNALKSQYDTLLAQYNALLSAQSIYIGTTLETYYQYVRLNYLTVTSATMDEARWHDYPNYYSISVKFAASLASHDIGNSYWSSLESGCYYYTYAGEYSYQTSSRIMQRAMSIAGISYSDSSVTKIQKVLAFIHSVVHYETRLLDHMWFPTETLTFRSGDCTGFSILASAMFEAAGIKSAVAFFTNSTLGGHAMVLVHLDNLSGFGYYYYSDLTRYGLAGGKWIIIEPQYGFLDEHQSNLRWISWWSIVACAEVPYGS
mgnify:CR=1 FL=1